MEGTLLNVRVSPGARRTEIEGPYGENAIKMRASSLPVNGRANAEVERVLANLLEIPLSAVSVVRGASSRDKTVLVRGLEPDETRKALAAHLG